MDRPSPHKREEQRLINRRQQGDLGEASAIEWLTRRGVGVWIPLGHSPDADLIADYEGRLLRVQVKTTTFMEPTPLGHERWEASLSTNGGNQSWNRVAKTFDPSRFDFLFVLVGNGRRWFIPASVIESTHTVRLGGVKYAEFEIGASDPIDQLVYGEQKPSLESPIPTGEYPSGQRICAVNASAYAFRGSNPLSPIASSPNSVEDITSFERKLGRAGQSVVRQKRQTTIPKQPFDQSGIQIGERVRWRADGEGRIVLERVEPNGNLFGDDP